MHCALTWAEGRCQSGAGQAHEGHGALEGGHPCVCAERVQVRARECGRTLARHRVQVHVRAQCEPAAGKAPFCWRPTSWDRSCRLLLSLLNDTNVLFFMCWAKSHTQNVLAARYKRGFNASSGLSGAQICVARSMAGGALAGERSQNLGLGRRVLGHAHVQQLVQAPRPHQRAVQQVRPE